MTQAPILFYAGVCHFCDATVRFVLRHEQRPTMRFMALQSEQAPRYLAQHGVTHGDLKSMLVLDGDHLLRESEAALFLCRQLRWPWRWLGGLLALVPRRLRNAAYRIIGSKRYRWWGRSDVCLPVPTQHRHRFLDLSS